MPRHERLPVSVPAHESRRLAALRQLASNTDTSEAVLVDLLRLVGEPLGAAALTLRIVDGDTVHSLASTSAGVVATVPRERSVAAVASERGEVVVRTITASESVVDPWLGEMDPPLTCVAVPMHAPGGQTLGAIEVVWSGVHELTDAERVALVRAAAHVSTDLELRAEVGEYRRTVELSPDALVVLDLEGTIELTNPVLCALVGCDAPEDLVGTPFVTLVARYDRTRVTAELARVLFARDRAAQIDLELVGPDGRGISCSVSVGHLGGPRRRLQLIIHDLSERLRDEEERTQLSEQLARAQRLDAVGRIASGLAHDLNNLLVVMIANLGLAQESLAEVAASSPEASLDAVREDLAELGIAVDRANGLTDKLLQFARQETAQGGWSEVAEVITVVQGFIGRSLGDGVRLRLEVEDDLPPVAADAVHLERVLVNLVINARDALVDGVGEVVVRATAEEAGGRVMGPDRRVTDEPRPGRPTVRIQVTDDGVGMDDATQARAFEPLFTTKHDAGGTGLGLATVLSFADEVDGSVELDSAVGRGTTVTLILPAMDQPVEEVPVGRDVPVGGARIVLVDPGERTQRVIARMLGGAGYRVRAFGSAHEALRAIRDDGADLVVTELALSGMSGTRLLDAARQDQPGLRAIVLTSIDGPRTLSGTPVLAKPFSHARLLRTVERVLDDV